MKELVKSVWLKIDIEPLFIILKLLASELLLHSIVCSPTPRWRVDINKVKHDGAFILKSSKMIDAFHPPPMNFISSGYDTANPFLAYTSAVFPTTQ